MDLFSLEEEDYGDMFITQTPRNEYVNSCGRGDNVNDGENAVGSMHYSDISDDDDLEFTSHNFISPTTGQPFRWGVCYF